MEEDYASLEEDMKKQELVHLHGLTSLVADCVGNDLLEEGSRDPDTFTGDEEDLLEELGADQYELNGVYPSSIHRGSSDHSEAVMELFDAVTEYVDHQ